MTSENSSVPRKLTSKWRLAELLSTSACFVVVFASSLAAAQGDKPALGPEQPAYPRDLESLRAELKAEAEANTKRLNEQLKKVEQQLAAERQQRDAERAEARAESENV